MRSEKSMSLIIGSCHCKNISYELWLPINETIAARSCSCSFCSKHSATYTSHKDAVLKATFKSESLVNRHTFATNTAQFIFCSQCGALPFVISAIDQSTYAVVNVNTFEHKEAWHIISSQIGFDAESLEERLLRRKRTWIPTVNITILDSLKSSILRCSLCSHDL